MKFYNREKELASLEKVRRVSFSVHSQMTVLTGRRRIGKTSLIFKSCEDTPTVYLFDNNNTQQFTHNIIFTSVRKNNIRNIRIKHTRTKTYKL